jgi:hypothetical protein
MIKDIMNAKTTKAALTELLMMVLSILVSTFVLRFTWNNSLSKHVSVLKPLNTFLDALLLSISIQVVRGI